MKYLIDTNVLSEVYKKQPDENVTKWLKEVNQDAVYLSCITIGELRAGAIKKNKNDKVAGKALFQWIESLENDYDDQIVNIDLSMCEIWSELLSIDNTNAIDSLIAAQAIRNNMTLVTRNIKHFKMYKMKLLNPFDDR